MSLLGFGSRQIIQCRLKKHTFLKILFQFFRYFKNERRSDFYMKSDIFQIFQELQKSFEIADTFF